MTVGTLIKRLQEIMRKDMGIDGDAQRLTQIVWMIFLMVLDYKEEEAELEDGYVPCVPEGYRWRDWAKPLDDEGNFDSKNALTGPELIDFVNNKLIPVLSGEPIKGETDVIFSKTDAKSELVKEMMRSSMNLMQNGYQLREVVNCLSEVDFSDSHEAHHFNDVYESLLRGLQSAGTMGEFYTNRAITSFCIDHVKPELGEKHADWACGTCGFGVDALNYLKKQVTVGDTEGIKALQHSIVGGEFKPMPYKLAVTNLMLHGVEIPDIRYGDSLSIKNLNDFRGNDLVKTCSLNPPYGGVALPEDLSSFPADMRSSETADLFVALAVKRLKEDGRGVIVLPDGFLFGTDNAKVAIKKYLMNECNLHTIIRLPQSCFAPYTSIATNLLFFDKGVNTHEVWFYRLDMPDFGGKFKKFSKTNPMKREHFAEIDEWWDNRTEIADETVEGTFKAKKYTIEEIEALGYNIDLCGYPKEKKEILSSRDTMSNFVARRSELDKLMDDKLAKIMALLEDKNA